MSDENGNDSDEELVSNFVVVPYLRDESDVEAEGEDEITEQVADTDRQVFDEDLPITHSYLGEMDRVSGRTIIPDNAVVTLPLLPGCPGTWVPGQTFPLMVRDHVRSELLRRAVEGDHTFGCRARGYRFNSSSEEIYGATCEIYEFSDTQDLVSIKAKVRQRFKKLNIKKIDGPVAYAEVQILPEITLRKPLTVFNVPSLNRVRHQVPRKCQIREAYTSPWPVWVHTQYDTDYLRKKVGNELLFLKQGLKKIKHRPPMPTDPTELSFWLGTHLGADERLFLIKENSPIRRLRWMLSLMMQCQQYCCHTCDNLIGYQKDFFAMSVEGAQSTYVNPGGYVHDTITLSTATNLIIISNPSTEYSWFPGYAWEIAVCCHCQKHIGWKFTSKKLVPKTFWGLSRQSLHTRLAWSADSFDDGNIPVM
uniref:Protein cereblon n=1 Tax=Lygus hesperus TaxID=30085 RepID=A0A0A9YEK0_LYGHE